MLHPIMLEKLVRQEVELRLKQAEAQRLVGQLQAEQPNLASRTLDGLGDLLIETGTWLKERRTAQESVAFGGAEK